MRSELELIKKVEDYLEGRLSAAEVAEFEIKIANDLPLQAEIKLQQEIMKGMERIVLKQMVQRAAARYRLRKRLIRWGTATLLIILVITVTFYLNHKTTTHHHQSPKNKTKHEYRNSTSHPAAMPSATLITRKVSPIDKVYVKPRSKKRLIFISHSTLTNLDYAGKNLKAQSFLIEASADTVIETNRGIVFSVAANSFRDNDGGTIHGKITLTIKEALTPLEIINAGLSTKSGNELLESGGMFFVDAMQDGKSLKIDQGKAIYAEIPTDSVKTGMQLYTGNQLPNGSIDWVKPQTLVHDLVPADIQSLNFYPPEYLDSLAKWGYDTPNKKFTDSLYYSFSAMFKSVNTSPMPHVAALTLPAKSVNARLQINKTGNDSAQAAILCGINPAKIKTIWNPAFQNTIISTREFEQRLYWLHKLGSDSYFDLYLDHLDQPLSAIDAMVANRSTGSLRKIFLNFASMHAGRVNNGAIQFKKLREYYSLQSKAYAAAIAKTESEFWDKQDQLDQIASSAKSKHLADSTQRINQNFQEELKLNMKNALRQLGLDTIPATRSVKAGRLFSRSIFRPNVYQVNVITTGWCNIDRAVSESTSTRTSAIYTDSQTGKQAVIKYLPVSFNINASKTYNRLYVYLLPDQLSSFMRVTESNGKYQEKLNSFMKYNLVCLGYNETGEAFLYTQNDIQPKDYPGIALTQVTNNQLELALNREGTHKLAPAIQNENEFFLFELKDQKRQKNIQLIKQLRDKLIKMLYPCYVPPVIKPAPVYEDE